METKQLSYIIDETLSFLLDVIHDSSVPMKLKLEASKQILDYGKSKSDSNEKSIEEQVMEFLKNEQAY